METLTSGHEEELSSPWLILPEHLMVKILQYLDIEDKFRATAVCTYWRDCFQLPEVWRNIHFRFILYYKTEGYMSVLKMFGEYFVNLSIVFNQDRDEHIENACAVLSHLSTLKENSLQSINLELMGGSVFNEMRMRFMFALRYFFNKNSPINVRNISFKGISQGFDDEIVDHIVSHKGNNIVSFSNWDPVCKVSPKSILVLSNKCLSLTRLEICYCCITEELLNSFAQGSRTRLCFLGITCRADQPITSRISSSAWKTLHHKSPDLRVSMKFERAFPSEKMLEIMQPEIPISILWLMTNYKLSKDIDLLTDFYSNTLEEVVIVPSAFVDIKLGDVLIKMARSCSNLKKLKVFGTMVQKSAIEKILTHLPGLKREHSANFFQLSYS
ncbi:hypothetical protein FSP39_009471 [Pinctada imbricata]|uniref:F-box domain-containing protein n=1 Tax=Pinctada imbricata TaxID=66713 RepID=A0AA88XQY6_PINIB|nr:hypothetical protein FSP39_009471 [Pinctada imbricata]